MFDSIEFAGRIFVYHHSAWRRGYITRKIDGVYLPYKGRFGEGVAIHRPSHFSTRYHRIEYWIEAK